ncbi:nucleotidyl transferase AbiEii/AbiGii toxin family protein [bacterium]|nr:nucleotidyl transferase AbiEii/AbiGii toxin family protein [bacterium]MBU1958676.1 nucleotidyl transferase AbiEii/AbiGii toxin family protein [bacterium]
MLKALSKSEHIEQAIFKGGTALSKAYRVIERFSEDIDLAVISTDMTSNQTKKLIKRIEKNIVDANFEEIVDHIQVSKGSEFRKTVYDYTKLESGNFGHANSHIIVELNSFAQPHPYQLQEISSYVYDFLLAKANDIITEYELEPFSVNILDYRRTFCEKLSAVARASHESDKDFDELKKKIRHLYDLYYLMQEKEIIQFLNSDDFVTMIQSVRVDDGRQFHSEWAMVPLYTTAIFSDTTMVLAKIEEYYSGNFADLIYSDYLVSMESIRIEIDAISDRLSEEEL